MGGSIVFGLLIVVFVVVMQFNFDLFVNRSSQGMDSRDSVFLEFNADFNSSADRKFSTDSGKYL